MDIAFAYLLVAVGLVIGGFVVWTWTVVHQAATEAREYFQRQNIDGRIEDADADTPLRGWESAE